MRLSTPPAQPVAAVAAGGGRAGLRPPRLVIRSSFSNMVAAVRCWTFVIADQFDARTESDGRGARMTIASEPLAFQGVK